MFVSNNQASIHLWWKKNFVKRQKVSKYYEMKMIVATRTLGKYLLG